MHEGIFMEHEKSIMDAIHSLTLVQRIAVFRPKPTQTTSALGTQVIFVTNELMHGIASHWAYPENVQREIDQWRHEITKLAARMPHKDQHDLKQALELANGKLAALSSLAGRERIPAH
jgi:hypothetical protein